MADETSDKPLFEIKLGRAGPRGFSTASSLKRYFEEELKAWTEVKKVKGDFKNWLEHLTDRQLGHVRVVIDRANHPKADTDSQEIANVKAALSPFSKEDRTNRALLRENPEDGAVLLMAKDDANAATMGMAIRMRDDALRLFGGIESHLFSEAVAAHARFVHRAATDTQISDLSWDVSRQTWEREFGELKRETKAAISATNKARDKFAEALNVQQIERIAHSQEHSDMLAVHKATQAEMEDKFARRLGLEKPVTYWRRRGK